MSNNRAAGLIQLMDQELIRLPKFIELMDQELPKPLTATIKTRINDMSYSIQNLYSFIKDVRHTAAQLTSIIRILIAAHSSTISSISVISFSLLRLIFFITEMNSSITQGD